jgi:hypothetical protein
VTSVRYVWLVCGLAILVLETIGSLAARHWGFADASLSAISYVLYFCAGVGAGRLDGVWAGGVAGAVTGLVDATLGWWISWTLGASQPARSHLPPLGIVLVALGVVFTGWASGLLGGAIGTVVHRHSKGQHVI